MVDRLVYTPLAPIVVICGTIYFWTVSIVVSGQPCLVICRRSPVFPEPWPDYN